MTKKRKSPRIRTKTTHSIVNGMLGDKPSNPEELKKIKRGGLGKDEYEGEGLPEKVLKEGEHRFFDFTFDMRFSHDKEGTIEVSFAGKNSGKHTKKVYEGLSEKQSCHAKAIFERNIRGFISNACYALALACIEKQSEDLTKRKEFLENIDEHTSKSYREILALGHERILEETEENGIKIEKSEFIDVGARPKTELEIEKEKQEFVKAVFDALGLIEMEGGKKTQTDIGLIVFEKELETKENIDVSSRMKRALSKYNLIFKILLQEYNEKKMAVK